MGENVIIPTISAVEHTMVGIIEFEIVSEVDMVRGVQLYPTGIVLSEKVYAVPVAIELNLKRQESLCALNEQGEKTAEEELVSLMVIEIAEGVEVSEGENRTEPITLVDVTGAGVTKGELFGSEHPTKNWQKIRKNNRAGTARICARSVGNEFLRNGVKI